MDLGRKLRQSPSRPLEEGLNDLLASVDPLGRPAEDPVRHKLIAEMAQQITLSTMQPPTAVRRRRPRRALVFGVAALLVASAFTFASEWFMSDADDFHQVVDELLSTEVMAIPLPPGETREHIADEIVADGRKNPGYMTEAFVLSTYVYKARCAWEGHWLTSYAEGDQEQLDEATRVLSQVPTWPTAAATDGGGMVQHYREIARAASAGDPRPLREDFEINCGDGVGKTNH